MNYCFIGKCILIHLFNFSDIHKYLTLVFFQNIILYYVKEPTRNFGPL